MVVSVAFVLRCCVGEDRVAGSWQGVKEPFQATDQPLFRRSLRTEEE